MAKNTPSKDASSVDLEQVAKPGEATGIQDNATASGAAGAQPTSGSEPGGGSGDAGRSLDDGEQSSAPSSPAVVVAVAPATAEESPTAAVSANDKSAPGKTAYTVTGLIDVQHDGELYQEGDTVWLDDDSAWPLKNKRYIALKEGRK